MMAATLLSLVLLRNDELGESSKRLIDGQPILSGAAGKPQPRVWPCLKASWTCFEENQTKYSYRKRLCKPAANEPCWDSPRLIQESKFQALVP